MNDTLGIIMTGFPDNALGDLTRIRSLAAVPVCGRYRLVDFILSNLVNSGITNVGIPMVSHYRSLMDHLGSGKEWDLNRKLYGLFILPPYIGRDGGSSALGDLDVLGGILDYLARSKHKYVLLSGCDSLYNTTFYGLRESHLVSGADITILCRKTGPFCAPFRKNVWLFPDKTGRLVDIEVSPSCGPSHLASMGVYFMRKDFLEEQIFRGISRGMHDFVMDILIKNIESMHMQTLEYSGYVGAIDCVFSYFRENLQTLDPNISSELFNPKTPIYTKVKDQVPTIYGEQAIVRNSVIADGCKINGRVENSLIFRAVEIESDAIVTNSIIMQNSQIQRDVKLDYSILDKNVVVRYSKRLMGQENFPVVIGKNAVI